ncbi:hypothetical protein [Paenibacillus sp. OK003]|uniref:hypothetical protein n=1 Tax=Paenibacillus sp. OK003 TaxID=1884380 RepID=UPI0008D60681|nr:hypothetical protein [Paenibacillus sp. OK003]SEK49181.1 hypothetical protein SAMN05518856_102337 [Paenibacillus sp. OK003]
MFKLFKFVLIILTVLALMGCNSKENLLNENNIHRENIIETASLDDKKDIIFYDDIDTKGISTAFVVEGKTGFGYKIIKTGSFLANIADTTLPYHVTNHKWSDNKNTSIIYGLINDPQITKIVIIDLTKQNFNEISPQIKEFDQRKLWYVILDKPFTSFELKLKGYNGKGELVYQVSP